MQAHECSYAAPPQSPHPRPQCHPRFVKNPPLRALAGVSFDPYPPSLPSPPLCCLLILHHQASMNNSDAVRGVLREVCRGCDERRSAHLHLGPPLADRGGAFSHANARVCAKRAHHPQAPRLAESKGVMRSCHLHHRRTAIRLWFVGVEELKTAIVFCGKSDLALCMPVIAVAATTTWHCCGTCCPEGAPRNDGMRGIVFRSCCTFARRLGRNLPLMP